MDVHSDFLKFIGGLNEEDKVMVHLIHWGKEEDEAKMMRIGQILKKIKQKL